MIIYPIHSSCSLGPKMEEDHCAGWLLLLGFCGLKSLDECFNEKLSGWFGTWAYLSEIILIVGWRRKTQPIVGNTIP